MTQPITCYKIVRRNAIVDGQLLSCVAGYSAVRLRYIPGQDTHADVGGCLVFKSAEDALEFFATRKRGLDVPYWELWRCVARDSVELGECLMTVDLDWFSSVRHAWRERVRDPAWPRGTLAFKTVRLTERLIAAMGETP